MPSPSSSPSSATLSVAVVAAASIISTVSALSVAYWWHQRTVTQVHQEWQSLRQEERTGRIRAEVKLRTLVKEQQQLKQQQQSSVSNTEQSSTNSKKKTTSMHLESIGVVVSPYTKRMGTPRQGALVPSSRGRIHFSCPAVALDGIAAYSHLWVVFEFHANTNVRHTRNKIRPPRADGKVGTLATRSPHRPNALGLSLVAIEKWDAVSRELHISGLDLVHHTPVYDVKPFVPWDLPGYRGPALAGTAVPAVLKTPAWVQQDDALARVEFCDAALVQLQDMVQAGRLAPLYTASVAGFGAVRRTLQEVLAQDPRSSHKGLKENARGSQSGDADATYKLIFGQTQVEFIVVDMPAADNDDEDDGDGDSNTAGLVQVVAVRPVDFDPEDYVDGVPLISSSAR